MIFRSLLCERNVFLKCIVRTDADPGGSEKHDFAYFQIMFELCLEYVCLKNRFRKLHFRTNLHGEGVKTRFRIFSNYFAFLKICVCVFCIIFVVSCILICIFVLYNGNKIGAARSAAPFLF